MRSWILPSIFGVSWFEWLGLPIPGEAALVSAGVVEGRHLAGVLLVIATAAVAAAANRGALVPGADNGAGTLVAGGVGAVCRGDYLAIGAPPAGFGRYVLPGNNYHVYDYNLFWADVRADVERRVAAFRR